MTEYVVVLAIFNLDVPPSAYSSDPLSVLLVGEDGDVTLITLYSYTT